MSKYPEQFARGQDPSPVRAGSRADAVYAELLKAINSGQFRPGARILENEIANWLNVSRTPVREALRRLQSEHILAKGDNGLAVPVLDEKQIVDLYAMREVLEGAAAALSALHASEAEIEVLGMIIDRGRTVPVNLADEHAQINKDFHARIYRAADNLYLLRSLQSLQDAMRRLSVTTFSWPGRPEEALKEHEGILRAIGSRDAEQAEHAARHHIRQALRYRLFIINDPQFGDEST